MLGPTHVLFALSLACVLRFPRVAAAVGGIIPDMDMVLSSDFPFSHRGLVHTPVFIAASIALLYLLTRNSGLSLGFGVGFLSHLFLDTMNPTGIAWFWPASGSMLSLGLVYYNNIIANIGILILSLSTIWFWNSGFVHERGNA